MWLPCVCGRLGLWADAREELGRFEQMTHISPEDLVKQTPGPAEIKALALGVYCQIRNGGVA